jgi:hypothetical protein
VDGDINTAAWLTNTDPGRVYCLANPNDLDSGVMHLRMLGWTVELSRKDGPQVRGGDVSKDGTSLEYRGGYVMSRTREAHLAELQAGWVVADQRARAIGQPGGIDGVRGVEGRLAQFASDPAEYVTRG